MKKALLFFGLLASTAYAQDCSKIFISEYVEGWSNNKALEIYNPTSQAIDLSEYFVARYSNGSASATVQNAVQLSGTIQPHDVFVAVLDKRDPAGTGQEAPIWDSLQARADGFFAPVYDVSNSFYWNGNDAVLLAKGTLSSTPTDNITSATGFQIIDIFGKIGENPGPNTGWSTTAPYNTGLGVVVTMDHSMIRKPSVKKGVTTQVASFNPLAEWDTIPAVTYLVDDNGDTIESQAGNPILFGNWFSLGEHECECTLGVEEELEKALLVYPNPTSDGIVYIKGAATIREVQVINALGQVISRQHNNSNGQLSVRIADRGVYIVRLTDDSGAVVSKRVVVK